MINVLSSPVNINEHRNEINLLSAQYISDPDMLAAKLVEQVKQMIMVVELSNHKLSSTGIPPVS